MFFSVEVAYIKFELKQEKKTQVNKKNNNHTKAKSSETTKVSAVDTK